jgi:hypothetical protein
VYTGPYGRGHSLYVCTGQCGGGYSAYWTVRRRAQCLIDSVEEDTVHTEQCGRGYSLYRTLWKRTHCKTGQCGGRHRCIRDSVEEDTMYAGQCGGGHRAALGQ